MLIILLSIATLAVAYANGANDNFKGVATLYGSNITSYRTALAITSVATACGGLLSVFIASSLIKTFSGAGVVPPSVATSPAFLTAVACGAAGTVFLATVLGLPISTTHALTGSIVGAGLVAVGLDLNFSVLGKSFLLPLFLGPFISIGLTSLLFFVAKRISKVFGLPAIPKGTVMAHGNNATSEQSASQHPVDIGPDHVNRVVSLDKVPDRSISDRGILRYIHFGSAALLCAARGMNDAPKIVALILAANAMGVRNGLLAIVFAMVIGGIVNSRKVAQTISTNISSMNEGQALTANIVSAALVIAASRFGLPVSTTHVTVGAITGIGLTNRTANYKVLVGIIMSWVGTLPLAALIASIVSLLLKGL